MITLVSPWYGTDTRGGAEMLGRNLAAALRAHGAPVRVWASTGRDALAPAAGHYPPGADELDGVPIWRFRPTSADAQGVPHFFRQHPELLPPLDQFAPHELRLLGTLLSSDELYAAIRVERERSVFIFLPYPFPTTFWGGLLAPERSLLMPCLHDEPYARYRTYRYLFRQVRGMLAVSHPEALLAQRLYDLDAARVHLIGAGIDLTPHGDGAAFRRRYGLEGCRLLLYAGRFDASKNTPLLVSYAREYWARRGGNLRLLLAGQGDLELPAALTPLVHDLGFLRGQAKHDAYAAADVFVLPSTYESFSIVLMEAWLQGTPALVHRDCAVTADHARRSGGGLVFGAFGEFAAALDLLLGRPAQARALGERGRDYVLATCRWDEVARRTAALALA